MRTIVMLSVVSALASISSVAAADEPGAATAQVSTEGHAPKKGDDGEKKLALGGDLQFLVPVGDFADATGPQIGPLFRAGYRVIPNLELTGRIGYLFGLNKSVSAPIIGSVSYNVSNIPVWLGARYFVMEPPAGVYLGAELALNIMSGNASAGGSSTSKGITREGFNLGAGYVVSKELPLDFRAQFSYFNLLGTDTGEKAALGIGISAGYSFFL